MTITPPDRPESHPDRFLDCQQAIEPGFQTLVEAAIAAGWSEVEAVAAIVELADNHMLAAGENAWLQQRLDELRRRGGL